MYNVLFLVAISGVPLSEEESETFGGWKWVAVFRKDQIPVLYKRKQQ